jgi:membrane protease YdiL (CAAX protease family)
VALASVLAALLATNLLTDRLALGLYLPTCVVAAVALLLIARRAGLGWAELGLGRATVRSGLRWALVTSAIVLAAYMVLLAIPAGRTVLSDQRGAGLTVGALLWYVLVRVPFGTVLLEEVAFRCVLRALLRRLGPAWATGVSSALFGLWHVLPLDRSHPSQHGRRRRLRCRRWLAPLSQASCSANSRDGRPARWRPQACILQPTGLSIASGSESHTSPRVGASALVHTGDPRRLDSLTKLDRASFGCAT